MQVIRHLEDVNCVIYGDFLSSGMQQALFLRSWITAANDTASDILSVVDAEIATDHSHSDGFGHQFLLTDFSQVKVDRWNVTTVLFHMPFVCRLLIECCLSVQFTGQIPARQLSIEVVLVVM